MSRSSALPRPKVKWHNFFLVCMLGIASGIFLGSWYSYSQITSVVDYSSYTEADLRDSIEDVIKDILNIDKPTTDQINNWLTLAKQKGITFGRPKIKMPKNFIQVANQYKNKEISFEKALYLTKMSKTTFYKYYKNIGSSIES